MFNVSIIPQSRRPVKRVSTVTYIKRKRLLFAVLISLLQNRYRSEFDFYRLVVEPLFRCPVEQMVVVVFDNAIVPAPKIVNIRSFLRLKKRSRSRFRRNSTVATHSLTAAEKERGRSSFPMPSCLSLTCCFQRSDSLRMGVNFPRLSLSRNTFLFFPLLHRYITTIRNGCQVVF